MKRTKIVATIGPASESREMLKQMIDAGMNVVRLNFSHNEHEWHGNLIQTVRSLSEELGKPVAILADIQGPRIRLEVKETLEVKKGDTVIVTDKSSQDRVPEDLLEKMITLDQNDMVTSIDEGHLILIEDGLVQLRVVTKKEAWLSTEVVNDGVIKNRKGVNLPDSAIHLAVLTEKDKKDLKFVVKEGVDYVGLSFVGSADDIAWVRDEMRRAMPGAPDDELPLIVSKIERKEAIKNLESIVRITDAVMVARGDLGIEMPESEVAILQKNIIAESLKHAKPVIVATQMMKSMTENPRPTRAEVSDVTNAAIDHADAVMLSEESAMGKYPVETVATMAEILAKTEASPFDDVTNPLPIVEQYASYTALVRSIYELAKEFEAKATLLISRSGLTARLMSHFRPDSHLFVATDNRRTWSQLALLWGVDSYLFEGDNDLDAFTDRLATEAKNDGRLVSGDKVVICKGRSQDDTLQLVGMKEVL